MRAHRLPLLPLLIALAACGPVAPPVARTPKATSKPVQTAASPIAPVPPSPSTRPAQLAPSPVPALLARPTGDVKVVAGVVRIDASYAVGAAGATLISNNGGTAVAAGGSLVSNNAGNLISEHGGSLISNNGGTVISDHGSALVGNNGGTYRLADAAPPTQGQILPAAGLVVAVRDLATGTLLSLGTTPQGQPVYEVLTNTAGNFELYLPPTASGALLLESRFPTASGKASDPRLQYDLVSDQAAKPLVIDEDTAQVSRYTRNTWKTTVKSFVLTDDVGTTARALGDEDGPYTTQVNAFITDFHAEAVKVGLNQAPAADVDAVAEHIADALVARVPLSQITLSKALWESWTGPEEPAIPALVDIMRQLREATNAKLAQDPHFFERQDFLLAINQERQQAGLPPYEIRKSTDIPELLMAEYLTKNRRNTDTEVVFNVLGVDLFQVQRLYAAVNNYIGAVTLVLLSDADAKAQAYALIDAYKPGAP